MVSALWYEGQGSSEPSNGVRSVMAQKKARISRISMRQFDRVLDASVRPISGDASMLGMQSDKPWLSRDSALSVRP